MREKWHGDPPPVVEHVHQEILNFRWVPGPDANEPGEKWEVRERRHPQEETTWDWSAGNHEGEEESRELARKIVGEHLSESLADDESAAIGASLADADDAAETAREIDRDMREIDDGPL
jgi:hypothetical protein